jgi:hypothetical protein
LILWESQESVEDSGVGVTFVPKARHEYKEDVSLTVCDGISLSDEDLLVLGCITTESQVHFYSVGLGPERGRKQQYIQTRSFYGSTIFKL